MPERAAYPPAQRLAEIRARAEVASPGPWVARLSVDPNEAYVQRPNDNFEDALDLSHRVPDAHFIAHAREDVPWLLAEVARLRQALRPFLYGDEQLDTDETDDERLVMHARLGDLRTVRAALAGSDAPQQEREE